MRHCETGNLLVLGLVNFIFLQWFFIRLGYNWNTKDKIRTISVLYWVVPLTGWWPFGRSRTFWVLGNKIKFGGSTEKSIYSYIGD